MSLFRSRAKILSPISHNYLSIPRSASEQSQKLDFKYPISEVSCIKNAAKTQDLEVQKAQVIQSRPLSSLFRKKGQTALEDTVTSIHQGKKDDSWLTKLFAKQPRPITPQGKFMIESREIQNKQLLGKLPTAEWKSNVKFITKNQYTQKSKLIHTSDPIPKQHQQIPSSAETQLKKMQREDYTSSSHLEKEIGIEKGTPKLQCAELKSQKEEIPDRLRMENFVNKRPCNINVLVAKERSTSPHSHKITTGFSLYTQQSLKKTEPTFTGIQPNTASIHTSQKTTQCFTHKNSIQYRKYAKITGHSLQKQVNNRKHMLAQTKNKISCNVLPACKSESIDQDKTAKCHNNINEISELSSLKVTPKSLTCIPKLSKENKNKTLIKFPKYGHAHAVSMTPQQNSEIINLTYLGKEVAENEQQSSTPELEVFQINADLAPIELNKWIRRIEAKECILCHDKDTKLLPTSQTEIKSSKNDFISKEILSEINPTSNHETSHKIIKKLQENLSSNSPLVSKSYTKNGSNSSDKMHVFHTPTKLKTTHSQNKFPLSSKNNELLEHETLTIPKNLKGQVTKISLKPGEHLCQNVISFTDANNYESNTQRNITNKINDKMSYSEKPHVHNISLRRDQITLLHTKMSELSKKSPSQSRSNLKDFINKEHIKTNEVSPSKPAINKQSALLTNNMIGEKYKYINMKSEYITNQTSNMAIEGFKSKCNEINSKLKKHSSLTDIGKMSEKADEKNLEYSLNKCSSFHNSPNNHKTYPRTEYFSTNKTGNTDIFLRKIYDKQAKKTEKSQVEQLQAKIQSMTTEHPDYQITFRSEKNKQFPQKYTNNSVSDIHFSEKRAILDNKHSLLQNKIVNQKADKPEIHYGNTLLNSLKEDNKCDGETRRNINEGKIENINQEKIKYTSQTGLITDNFTPNISSENNESLKLIHDTIQPLSDKSLIPIETNNSVMNNWTFSNIAAYFYGAIFSKLDMLNLDLHKAIENNKELKPVIVDREIKEIFNTKTDNMKPEPIHSEAKVYSTTQDLKTKTTINESEIKDEQRTNLLHENKTPSRSETPTTKSNHGTQNLENQYDLRNTVQNRDKIKQNATGIAQSLLTRNSLTTPIQCSKRNYSNWKIQEPFNFGSSSIECKKHGHDHHHHTSHKKKDICKKKHKTEGKKHHCPEKKHHPRQHECKKMHMPGCPRVQQIKCCVESSHAGLPCIKKPAPYPSFSECLKYPIHEHKHTECDCITGRKHLLACVPKYEKPKIYNACKKEIKRDTHKKKMEEELVDDDEGELPPCHHHHHHHK